MSPVSQAHDIQRLAGERLLINRQKMAEREFGWKSFDKKSDHLNGHKSWDKIRLKR